MPRCIGVGTDCSGMEAPIQAMENLGVDFAHRFSCDIDRHARATIEANFPHGRMYEDVTARDNAAAPHCDLYVAGFPCQPFSCAGLQQGFKDKRGRGKIFFFVRDYIATQRPGIFILENVSGLKRMNKGEYFKAILKSLQQLGEYNISHQILNTKQHGVPHNRPRMYIVGIRQDVDRGTFAFPEPIPCPSMELFLDGRPKSSVVAAGLPPKCQGTAHSNVVKSIRKLEREGSDPLKEPYTIDCDSSANRSKWMHHVSPCITCSRRSGHWVTSRGRRQLKTEMMRLQGMDPSKFRQAVSDPQLGKQLGNTMSVNVLERLLVRLLPAAGLVSAAGLRDRWEDGSAVRALARTRNRGFAQTSRLRLRLRARAGPKKRKASGGAAVAAAGATKRARTAAP
mmetsp:Transcript_33738/g.85296  ORF Transcript_33738/g.85296 Transcript_33738/m.85296 type:complete len:396 (+) Transcript_33738:139-1326(+)